MKKTINISLDFSDTPGGRNYTDGPFTGEEFRDKFLAPLFEDKKDNDEIVIIMDGVALGFPISFLEEAFGGTARVYGNARTEQRIKVISNEDPLLIDQIKKIIREA